jgi:uncharacterized protein
MARAYDFRTVQLHLTDRCNLRCSYCYEDRAPRSSATMSAAVAQEIAARHLNEEGSHARVEFDFIGGEPLLAWDTMVSMVEFVHYHKWPRTGYFSFSTNGTLLNDEIKGYLDRHSCISLSFSIDGTREAHNLNRNRSYDRMIRHVPWAMERCRRLNIEPRVKMTISAETVPMIADGVIELHQMGFKRVDANVPYENIWNDRLDSCLDTFAGQLDRLVDFYLAHPELEPARLIDLPIMNVVDERKDEQFPRWCGSGDPMICYDVEGRARPCHRFVGVSTGKEYSGPLSFEPKTWEQANRTVSSPCVECPFVGSCPSCMALNWLENGDVDRRTRWHCGFILLQIKASAKFRMLRLSRAISAPCSNAEERAALASQQSQLDHAVRVYDLLAIGAA